VQAGCKHVAGSLYSVQVAADSRPTTAPTFAALRTDQVSRQHLTVAPGRGTMDTNFVLFCILASVNHSVSYVATFFSSSLLPAQLASLSLGLLWASNALVGLFLASSMTQFLGLRGSLVLSFAGYALQIGCLYLSMTFPASAWILSLSGSIFAGSTSAIWWDCQALVVESASVSSTSSTDSISSGRSSNNALWTLIYQGLNMAIFLSLTLLQYGGAPLASLLQSLFFAAAASTAWVAVMKLAPPLEPLNTSKASADEPPQRFSQVLRLFAADYRCSLLAPTQTAFGIATALFAYYVNAELISGAAENGDASVGVLYLGVLESFAYLVSALAAYPYSYLVRRYDAISAVMVWGNLCFLLSAALVLAVPLKALKSWPWLLLLKALYGLGRGIFEGENRSYYMQLFTGPSLVIAFSQQGFLCGLSGGVSFLSAQIISANALASAVVVNGVLSMAALWLLARNLAHRQRVHAESCGVKERGWGWEHVFEGLVEGGSSGEQSRGIQEPLLLVG